MFWWGWSTTPAVPSPRLGPISHQSIFWSGVACTLNLFNYKLWPLTRELRTPIYVIVSHGYSKVLCSHHSSKFDASEYSPITTIVKRDLILTIIMGTSQCSHWFAGVNSKIIELDPYVSLHRLIKVLSQLFVI